MTARALEVVGEATVYGGGQALLKLTEALGGEPNGRGAAAEDMIDAVFWTRSRRWGLRP